MQSFYDVERGVSSAQLLLGSQPSPLLSSSVSSAAVQHGAAGAAASQPPVMCSLDIHEHFVLMRLQVMSRIDALIHQAQKRGSQGEAVISVTF